MTTHLLRTAGTSLLLVEQDDRLPMVAHWGADLGELSTEQADAVAAALVPPVPRGWYDTPSPVGLLPEAARGWSGRPGVQGSPHEPAGSALPRFTDARTGAAGAAAVTVDAPDPDLGLALHTDLELAEAGLVRLRHRLTNTGERAYDLAGLLGSLPLPARAGELLDLTGRWARERSPQWHRLAMGAWVRESRHGRTGHDAPLLLVAGTPGFGFRSGEVWGMHVAWSGDHVSYAERLPTGEARLGGGELLAPGEVTLAPGESYQTPWLLAGWSDEGLDGLSARFHRWVRSRPSHPVRPRPVVLNTWEAVYFDHDLDVLRRLADTAAAVGVERYVLDDGWFLHRRNDTAGLGDWRVDPTVWPQGLHPLVDHVRGLGMEFGLWVEPEMVNPDSDLARAHPDWLLRGRDELPPSWRSQQVLDLQIPEAFGYVRDALTALLDEYPIGFLKWDHNRDLTDAAHAGRPAVHGQTLALYRLLDELREAHPDLEVESCSSGGARVDLEILQRTDRVWASDCNDPVERQAIQRWTGLLLPPELVGSHVASATSHTTGRTHRLAFRAATALFGHFGIEWDITAASDDERRELAEWVALYKRERDLLHSGVTVRADTDDPGLLVHGVVAPDAGRALFAVVALTTGAAAVPAPVRLPGLAPEREYTVEVPTVAGGSHPPEQQPPWMRGGRLRSTGRALGEAGLALPVLAPESALVLAVTADG